MKDFKNIPTEFEIIKKFEQSEIDQRYYLAKIKVMHAGNNFNGSKFSKEVIEKCMHSAINMPIIGHIVEGEDGADFSDHRYELERDENGEIKFVCKETCIGVVPESAKIYMENIVDDLGVARDYLIIDGALIWSIWDDVNNIFAKNNAKSHSCELSDMGLEGEIDDDGYFNFTNFNFKGFTVLGEGVSPAMSCSDIVIKNFAKVNMDIISDRLNEFNRYFSAMEGGEKVEENILETEVTEVVEETTEETPVIEETPVVEEVETAMEEAIEETIEETETPKEVETVEEEATAEPTTEVTDEEATDDFAACGTKDKKKKKYELEFTISHEEISGHVWDKLYDLSCLDNIWYGLYKTTNDYFIYGCNETFYKQGYSIDGDVFTLVGEREKVYSVVVDEETFNSISAKTYAEVETELGKVSVELETTKAELEKVFADNKALKDFKAEVEHKENVIKVNEVVSRFSQLQEVEYATLKDKAINGEISCDELEDKLFALIGRKNFSAKTSVKPNEFVAFSLNTKEEEKECPYQGIEHLFRK